MWADTWITDMRDSLILIRGNGPTYSDGQPLPALTAADTIAVIGKVTEGVVSALRNFNSRANGEPDSKVARKIVSVPTESGGVLDSIFGEVPGRTDTLYLNAADYLKAYPIQGMPSVRSPIPPDSEPLWSPIDENGYTVWTDRESQLLTFVRQMIDDWQRLCDASAATLSVNAANINTVMDYDDAANFWGALGSLCSSLDVLNENPPLNTKESILQSLNYALGQSSEFVGKSLADISTKVGETAANVTKGFFENAGLLAVAVAGIALYLYIK